EIQGRESQWDDHKDSTNGAQRDLDHAEAVEEYEGMRVNIGHYENKYYFGQCGEALVIYMNGVNSDLLNVRVDAVGGEGAEYPSPTGQSPHGMVGIPTSVGDGARCLQIRDIKKLVYKFYIYTADFVYKSMTIKN
ncbi:hypothetical protein ACJX0J_039981, partial [Zea mays]